MDFISRKPSDNSDPLASRPETRPAQQPRHVEKTPSVADQIPQKGAHIEKVTTLEPHRPKPEITIKKDAEKAFISREPATSRDLYAEPIDPNRANPATKTSSHADHLSARASFTLSDSTKKDKEPTASPDGNAYSLSGKSPFLPHYSVDKRPLSNSIPDKKTGGQFEKLSYLGVGEQGSDFTRKNIYDKSEGPSDTKLNSTDSEPVKIIDDTKKKHGMPTWLIIILTIILGAGVGAGVYFLLPK